MLQLVCINKKQKSIDCLHNNNSNKSNHGYKNHNVEDESRNSWIASLITLGEGWHNNHHANSKAWNNQERWWELDPPAWIIRAIKNDK